MQYKYRRLCCSSTNGLLISDFGSSTRGERHSSYLLTQSQRTAHLVVFKISVCRDPKILPATATVENSTLCSNGRNSIVCPHGPISSLNSNYLGHLFRAWRHPHYCPISSLGVHNDNGDCHILCARG